MPLTRTIVAIGSHEEIKKSTMTMTLCHYVAIIGEWLEWYLGASTFDGPFNMLCTLWILASSSLGASLLMLIWFLMITLNSFNIIIRKHLDGIFISTTWRAIFDEYDCVGAPSHSRHGIIAALENGRQKTRARGLFLQKHIGYSIWGAGTLENSQQGARGFITSGDTRRGSIWALLLLIVSPIDWGRLSHVLN